MILAFVWLTGYRSISAKDALRLMSLTGQVEGLYSLWFVPYILFCYMITPIF